MVNIRFGAQPRPSGWTAFVFTLAVGLRPHSAVNYASFSRERERDTAANAQRLMVQRPVFFTAFR